MKTILPHAMTVEEYLILESPFRIGDSHHLYLLYLIFISSLFQASFLNKKLNINGKRVNLAIWVSIIQFHRCVTKIIHVF